MKEGEESIFSSARRVFEHLMLCVEGREAAAAVFSTATDFFAQEEKLALLFWRKGFWLEAGVKSLFATGFFALRLSVAGHSASVSVVICVTIASTCLLLEVFSVVAPFASAILLSVGAADDDDDDNVDDKDATLDASVRFVAADDNEDDKPRPPSPCPSSE